jgi:hypothetical protein
MPPSRTITPDPVEFSVDDAIVNTWSEESGDYLRLEPPPELVPADPPPPDHS